MTSEESIEDRIRRRRNPANPEFLEAVISDVADRPGYFHAPRFAIFRGERKRLAAKVIKQAVRDGKLNRGFDGTLFPATVKPTPFWRCALAVLDVYGIPLIKPVAYFAAFVAMFLVTMTQGPKLIDAYGLLGYLSTGAGVLMSFVIAGCFYARVWR